MTSTALASPKIIGLTGSIGSGKSEAAKCFKELGAHIIDADELAREVVEPGKPALKEIEANFGKGFILPDGALNRTALGELIFSDAKARRELEDILHPLIRKLFLEKLATLRATKADKVKLIVYVIPLLFESRYEYEELDYIVVVSAPREHSLKRIIARDKCSREFAEKKYGSQLPIEDKEKEADFVIKNDGSLDKLSQQVKELYEKLLH